MSYQYPEQPQWDDYFDNDREAGGEDYQEGEE